MLGSGLNTAAATSPPPSRRSPSMRSATNDRTVGSRAATLRGVKALDTRRRNSVWAGGSIITMGRASSRPANAMSS